MGRDELFSVADVARLFDLQESRLRYWDQTGFISPSQRRGGRRLYAFRDLIAVKAAKALLASGASLQMVRRGLEQLRAQLPDVDQPLAQLRIVCKADRIVVLSGDAPFDAVSGQVLMQFGTESLLSEATGIVQLPTSPAPASPAPPEAVSATETSAPPKAASEIDARTAYQWFLEGCRLDEHPDAYVRALAAYQQALELDPSLAAAHTNLGNLYHRMGKSELARERYEHALSLDPDQPEARFNRANLLEDLGELDGAIADYRQVLLRLPDFADAHYNLALALERAGSRLEARLHWERYLSLEPNGPWAKLARNHIALNEPKAER